MADRLIKFLWKLTSEENQDNEALRCFFSEEDTTLGSRETKAIVFTYLFVDIPLCLINLDCCTNVQKAFKEMPPFFFQVLPLALCVWRFVSVRMFQFITQTTEFLWIQVTTC